MLVYRVYNKSMTFKYRFCLHWPYIVQGQMELNYFRWGKMEKADKTTGISKFLRVKVFFGSHCFAFLHCHVIVFQ